MYKNDTKNKFEKIQMDEIIKSLFTMSKRPIIDFLNSAYHENISYDADIIFVDKEFIGKSMENEKYLLLRGDMIITVKENEKETDYEIEFQTIHDEDIIIRLFRYGFSKAIRDYKINSEKDGIIEIEMPKPYLILLEENENVKDTVKLKINAGNGKSLIYESEVLKYWEYGAERLYKENMYLLLSLQLFRVRKKLQSISRRKDNNEAEKEFDGINRQIEEITKQTIEIIKIVEQENKILSSDVIEMLEAFDNILIYLDNRFKLKEEIKKEVKDMLSTLYDPKIEEKGIEKGIKKGFKETLRAQRLIKQGYSIDEVKRETGFSTEEIEEIAELVKE